MTLGEVRRAVDCAKRDIIDVLDNTAEGDARQIVFDYWQYRKLCERVNWLIEVIDSVKVEAFEDDLPTT